MSCIPTATAIATRPPIALFARAEREHEQASCLVGALSLGKRACDQPVRR
jgi:hypothetical protein